MFLPRIYWLLKYHQLSQFLLRAMRIVVTPLRAHLFVFTPRLHVDFQKKHFESSPSPSSVQSSLAILEKGKLNLLNREMNVGWPIDWVKTDNSNLPLLCKFNFHYHEFLLNIAKENSATTWQIIKEWISQYQSPSKGNHRIAWHPYVISRRLEVWFHLLQHFPPPLQMQNAIAESYARQSQWLSTNLEIDVRGNHLWENAKALILASTLFEGPASSKWRQLGISLLNECLRVQLLDSGEHYERSPSYQFHLAHGLKQLHAILTACGDPNAKVYGEFANKMFSFLNQIVHPDKTLPLFGDSIATSMTNQLAPPNVTEGWVGTYYTYRRDPFNFIFDAGQLSPDELPAHAHSDLLTFELSVLGQRIIVDSGTFCYEGEERNQYRSTSAHNTLMLDGVELADVWSSFRMGRRGHVIQRDSGSTAEGTWVIASHDAYRHLGVPLVTRVCFISPCSQSIWSFFLLQARKINSTANEWIHFHPQVQINQGTTACEIKSPKGTFYIRSLSNLPSFTIEPSTFSPNFYVEELSNKLRLSHVVPKNEFIASGWVFSLSPFTFEPKVEVSNNSNNLTLTCQAADWQTQFSLNWNEKGKMMCNE